MGKREDNIEVFQDTLAWFESDSDLAAAIEVSKATTQVFFEDEYPAIDGIDRCEEVVEVVEGRSAATAMRLHAEDPTAKIAVLNFANAFKPGGGVEWGAGAQEESLCRVSTLYPVIEANAHDPRRSFYQHHRDLGRDVATDSLIYSPGIVLCKSDESYPQRLRFPKRVTVDVITMAAPDLRRISMSDAALFGYHVKRAMHLLTVAASKGVDVLVLGAFGCGAFHNDPRVVAYAWHVALNMFPKVFKRVVFAILGRKGAQYTMREVNSGNLAAFQAEFAY